MAEQPGVRVKKQAAALAAAAALVVKQAEQIVKQAEQDAPRQSPVQAPAQIIAAQAAAPAHAKLTKRERRVQSREDIDTSAVIHLINVAARLPGRILDLSLGGCRIRTDERFPVGIYTRVETEFRLEGMPFRLGGVIQAIHDPERRNVGIRFVDMSERRREQIEQLIEEIQELRELGTEGTENREEGSDKTLP